MGHRHKNKKKGRNHDQPDKPKGIAQKGRVVMGASNRVHVPYVPQPWSSKGEAAVSSVSVAA